MVEKYTEKKLSERLQTAMDQLEDVTAKMALICDGILVAYLEKQDKTQR